MSALSLRRVRRRLQQIANARPRGDAEHVGAAAQGPGVGTDPTSTVGRQEPERPLQHACCYCRRATNPDGTIAEGVPYSAVESHGICRGCLEERFPVQAAEIHAAREAVAS